jgi:uncharacterized membrane protein YeaQ/YmgE (transglycosylase-associated protein family)
MILQLLVLLFVAGVCGSIARGLAGQTRGGCLVSIALGFIGALIGRWLAEWLGLPEIIALRIGNQPFPVVWSIIGASLFVAVLALLSGGPRDRRNRRWR